MPKRILDTGRLINFWHSKLQGGSLDNVTQDMVKGWARELVNLRESNAIVSPVEVEFLAGARNGHELELFRAFLAVFEVVDAGHTLPQDWQKAKQFAQRVPHDGKRRQMGDCLIKGIAERFKRDVDSPDKRFHH